MRSPVSHGRWCSARRSGGLADGARDLAVQAARDTAGQLLAIVLITGAIGVGPFHHVVLGSTELLTALFAGTGTSWSQYLHVLLWAALGNIVGGAVFVGLLNYG